MTLSYRYSWWRSWWGTVVFRKPPSGHWDTAFPDIAFLLGCGRHRRVYRHIYSELSKIHINITPCATCVMFMLYFFLKRGISAVSVLLSRNCNLEPKVCSSHPHSHTLQNNLLSVRLLIYVSCATATSHCLINVYFILNIQWEPKVWDHFPIVKVSDFWILLYLLYYLHWLCLL